MACENSMVFIVAASAGTFQAELPVKDTGDKGYSIAKLTRSSHFQWRHRSTLRMSPCLSAPDRDAAEVRDRREMHQESDAELLKVRATGNECKKELAQEEPEHREDGRNAHDREMDGCRLYCCARRLDYYHCRIRPLGRASDLLTRPSVSKRGKFAHDLHRNSLSWSGGRLPVVGVR